MYTGVTASCNMAFLGLMVAERGGLANGEDWDTADPFTDRGTKLNFAALLPTLLEHKDDRRTMGGVDVLGGTFWAVADFISASSCSLFFTFVTTAWELHVLGPGWALPSFSFFLNLALRF